MSEDSVINRQSIHVIELFNKF